LTDVAAALADLLGDGAWLGWVVFLRVGAAMALLPAFGSDAIPVRMRLALGLAFTAIVAPAVADRVAVPAPDLPTLVGLSVTEAAAGLALGASVRLMFWLLQTLGTIAAQAISLAQLLGSEAVDPQPAFAQLLLVAGLALAALMGLHVRIAEALIVSYDTLPAGGPIPARDLAHWAVAGVSEMFTTAFSLAAPFLIASVIYNLALGVINRAMPQLMVAFVGAPAITAGGLFLLMIAAPVLLPLWSDLLVARLAAPFAVAP